MAKLPREIIKVRKLVIGLIKNLETELQTDLDHKEKGKDTDDRQARKINLIVRLANLVIKLLQIEQQNLPKNKSIPSAKLSEEDEMILTLYHQNKLSKS
jgi:hypothetical protein